MLEKDILFVVNLFLKKALLQATDEIAMRKYSHQPKMILWRITCDL
jgi:hypothetical protein